MATANVLNWKKEKVGTVDLAAEIFEVEVKKEILHEVVNWQLACRRQGTAMVKTRSLVSGGGKKPFKQKGTGSARQGSTRSPLMPGGAKLFGPVPRSYEYALPKKVRKLGLKMALSHLMKEGRLFVVDTMVSEGKTSELAKRLETFGLSKAVLIDGKVNETMKRASRNLPTYKFYAVDGLNVFDLLKYDAAVITKDSVAKIVDRCQAE
ncbi:MAG: 50S ribosomal protein L4 [Bdellovibrionaceae bacterium]|nr:50S ribosomal protein L4 [Pseudobdellovibrionaceae bacterium]